MNKNLQTIFNTAVEGLASQGFRRSMQMIDGKPTCAYRGKNGRRCAIGWNISDENYDSSLENMTVAFPEVRNVIIFGGGLRRLSDLQYCHDHAKSPKDMRDRLIEYAKIYELEIPAVLID